MAGLLSGYVGDDEIKDEFGMTQADRRQPIFSGLINAGLLGVAAGGNLMPEQRAQLIGQMGGAIAGIPREMREAAAAGAQRKLQGQTLAEGARKNADRERLRQMAQSPEFQDKVKQLDPAEQMLLKAAIENGDLAHATSILGNAGKAELRQQGLALQQEKLDLAKRKAEDALTQQGGWGNSFEGRARTILARGKTNPELLKDPEFAATYAQAHEYLGQERPVTIGGATMVLPKLRDIDDYPKPGVAPAPGSPNAAAPPQEPPPAPGAPPRVNQDGSKTWTEGGEVKTEYPGGRLEVRDLDGRKLRTEEPQKPDPHLVQELTKIEAAEAKIQTAGKAFIAAWRNASREDKLAALSGRPSNMTEAWTNLAALIKESAVFNLGVLNGGDKAFIEGAIQNPASFMAQWGGNAETAERRVQRIFDILQAGKDVYAKRVNSPPSRAPKSAAPPPAGNIPTYNPATGKIE